MSTDGGQSAGKPRVTPAWQDWLKPVASLKLTVALFPMAIFIVLAGTFAQVNDDIWKVVHDYFRVDVDRLVSDQFPYFHGSELVVWVKANLFFPRAFFPASPTFPTGLEWLRPIWPTGTPKLLDGLQIPFPKGWVIGAAMMLNLLAAHLIRFKIQARGSRLLLGSVVLGLGVLITLGVIFSGSNADGLQAMPWISYTRLWWLIQTTLFGLCGVSIYAAATADPKRAEQRWLFGVIASILAVASVLSFRGDGSDEPTMRILYQVIKATFASVVLLTGCIALFKRRAGIVLLHAGVLLIMGYDVLVGVNHVESSITLMQGETTNFSRDTREAELAILDRSSPDEDRVIAINERLFDTKGDTISDPRLPFSIEVLEYYSNSDILGPRQPVPENVPQENPATAGLGLQIRAIPQRGATGTDTSGRVDFPSAYVRLTSQDGEDLGVYMLSSLFDSTPRVDTVTVNGTNYDISLRFKRIYFDYTITLKEFQKNDYVGTDRARDYSSFIVVNDPDRETTFDYRIWMNNPMRYAGKTFYQQSFLQGNQGTVLQVVDNVGWMTPYVACMMVVVGMLFHFGQTLLRFLHRRMRETAGRGLITDTSEETTSVLAGGDEPREHTASLITALTLSLLALGVLAYSGLPPRVSKTQFPIHEFGALPMWYKGRPMPIDSFARNTLLQLSDRQTFKDAEDKSQPAVRWMLDLMADYEKARDHRIIRIENENLVEAIGLKKQKKHAYTVNEVNENLDALLKQAMAAQKVPSDERTLYQKKALELANRMIFYSLLERTLGNVVDLPRDENEDAASLQDRVVRVQQDLAIIRRFRESLEGFAEEYSLGPLPLVVPTHYDVDQSELPDVAELRSKWEPVSIAHLYEDFYDDFPVEKPVAIETFLRTVEAYRNGSVKDFRKELADYRSLLKRNAASDDLPLTKVSFEAWYNSADLFNMASWLYVFVFILAVLSWLTMPEYFQRSAYWVMATVFLVHTAAIIARLYISGRPPVTNLYSSAVFIGWATVLFSLIIERLSRLGLATVVGAVLGFASLRIAHALASDGDTFVVLEAVLDTQFWLATHVVCITLGYATTYLAGALGATYLIRGIFTTNLTPHVSKELTRMTYGVLCFATFFSFWGTVLGGLWADDSWGRFWGWDPKENGALIIVLWNALILHARWGNMVRDRGLAVLSVLGNIVVSWSWFGTNELNVGLHSYGFTEGRLFVLALFVGSQLVLAGIGCLPRDLWLSSREPARDLPSEA